MFLHARKRNKTVKMDPDLAHYSYDIHKKEVINECNLYPTDIKQSEMHWLYASNNKYDDDALDNENIGKWMLFVTRDHINAVWDKIKLAVKNGDLWHSKVSTSTPEPGRTSHAIMIYTADYLNLDDVIGVLDFLERSGIKSPQTTIRYKTDQQTRAGIYRGGAQRPWIYSSDTIRQGAARIVAMSASGSNSLNWRDRSNQF